MINYNEINDFIIKVFNYYNGRINIVNKAVLDINWANLIGCSVGGYSRLPNIVMINPSVIIRFYNNDEFIIKLTIIDTIIHELYHTDQLINYRLYTSDLNYNKFIEHACEVQTTLYIVSHIEEIYNVFWFDISLNREDYAKYMKCYDQPGITYQRRYYNDHIFMCVDDMCNRDKKIAPQTYDYIKYNIENKKDIIININNEQINVCANGTLMHVNEFNKRISKYTCNGLHDVSYDMMYDKHTKEFIMNIRTQIMNLMCKKL